MAIVQGQQECERTEHSNGTDNTVQECAEENDAQSRADLEEASEAHSVCPAQAWTEACTKANARVPEALKVTLLEGVAGVLNIRWISYLHWGGWIA